MLGFILWFSLSLGLQEAYTEQYVYAPIFVEIELHAENDWIDIYGIYRNEMIPQTLVSYRPVLDYYTVGARVKHNNISLTAEHQCYHPVVSWGKETQIINGGYNRIYVTITSKESSR